VEDDVLELFAVRGEDPTALARAIEERVGGVADRVGLVSESTDPAALAAIAAAL
jgi:hypothetical protein